MRFSQKKSFSKISGMTIIETMIAIAILAFILPVAGTLIYNLSKSQSQISAKSEANEFISAVSKYLLSQQGCQGSLINLPIPGTTPANFTLLGFTGAPGAGLSNGSLVTPRLRIDSLTIRDKGIIPTVTMRGLVPFNRTIVQIKFKLSVLSGTSAATIRERIIEVPVLEQLLPLSGKVDACNAEINLEDTCLATGGLFTPPASCTPATTCEFKGMAFGCWPYSACPNTTYPLATKYTIPTAAAILTPPASVCPLGGTPTSTGSVNYSYSVPPCNKYGACATQYNNAYFYICLKCN